jgi:subtilase family serine protease
MSKSRASVCLMLVSVLSTLSFAVSPDRIAGALTSSRTIALQGSVHRYAQAKFDEGMASPSLRFGSLTLLTTPTAAQQKALKTLLAQQQDPKSANYHKWLTPEQWADRFGLSSGDITTLTTWLKAQGFTVGYVARGRNWITFSGTAAQIQAAFGTEIHQYRVNGELHVANATAPKIPAQLIGVVTGIRGMNDFHLKPRARRNLGARPNYTDSTVGTVIAPGDIATIYDINALYSGGIDGTGQKLAIIGQTDVYLADINDFRTGFGLSSISCTTTTTGTTGVIKSCNDPHFQYVFVNDQTTTDPLTPLSGDLSEADLDLEWSGAVAKNAQIIFVNAPAIFSGSSIISGGVWDAWYWAVDHNLAPVISMSYGLCEFFDNQIEASGGVAAADETELQQANSEGITFVNSSGDSGSAECDSSSTLTASNLATQGIAVGYPASSPEVTGVGGSAISVTNLDNATYWNSSNGSEDGSALSYIPEQAWNDDDEFNQFCAQSGLSTSQQDFCKQGGTTPQSGWVAITSEATAQTDIGPSSGGGGVSNCALQNSGFTQCVSGFAQPAWQSTLVIPSQSAGRFSPDVSLLATPNFPGYIFCTNVSELNVTGSGSSCAGGIQNAVDADFSIIGGTSASAPVFAGMVALLNQYLTGTSTVGLGNINPMLYSLAATPANGAFHPITSEDNLVYCSPGTPSSQPLGLQCPSSGTAVFGFQASNKDPLTSYNLVTGLGSVDAYKLAQAWNGTRTPTTISISGPGSSQAVFGQSVTFTATLSSTTALGNVVFFNNNSTTPLGSAALTSAGNGVVTFATTALPAGTDNVTATYTGDGTNASSTTVTAVTLTVIQPTFALASNLGSGATLSVTAGGKGSVNLTVSSTDGFITTTGGNSQTVEQVTYSCTGLPSESTCTFSPSSTTQSTAVALTITTTAPTAKLSRPLDRGSRIFYAALLPGLVGLVLTFGSRKRSLRGMRMLSLILVLGFSTMWMASCSNSSGGGGSNSNPGTPAGSYPITVNATTANSGPSASTSFTLQVQ